MVVARGIRLDAHRGRVDYVSPTLHSEVREQREEGGEKVTGNGDQGEKKRSRR